ncbi:hypothetical protein [Leuconostoc mesenteroides]|uniref:hypothetical protein n=1 Tax=Leuconostoc mesenteroides TaxID=1245 RepID=UPI0023628617|nr:hypothetical protein [Leuconostoc mesenteroides]
MAEQKQNNANIFLKLFIALMFFIGFLVFMYPFIANGVNNYVAQKELNAVNQLNQSNQKASAKKLEKLIKKNEQKSTTWYITCQEYLGANVGECTQGE